MQVSFRLQLTLSCYIMYSLKVNSTRLLGLAVVAAMFSACTKDKDQPAPAEEQHQITINLTESLPASGIDSAVVLFTRSGKPDSLFKKMAIEGNKAVLNATLATGNWKAEPFVYTKKLEDNSYRVYRTQGTLQANAALTLTGPVGKQNDTWLPAVMLKNEEYGLTLIMAERPDDPYLEIRIPANSTKIQGVAVDRVLWKDNHNDGEDYLLWYLPKSSLFKAKGHIYDTQYYNSYCNRIKTKPWDFMDFACIVYDNSQPNGEKVLWVYQANKRP